jgi:hypothetical protein
MASNGEHARNVVQLLADVFADTLVLKLRATLAVMNGPQRFTMQERTSGETDMLLISKAHVQGLAS